MDKPRSLGAMLQGISQQPVSIRTAGTVEYQKNIDSDVVDGLSSRPPADLRAYIQTPHDDLRFLKGRADGENYIVGYRTGVLSVWDTQGVEYTVSPNNLGYVGSDMAIFGSGSDMYLTNRNTITAKEPAPRPNTYTLEHTGVVYCLGGKFSRTYSVTVRVGGNTYKNSYTTPDGTTTGDAEKTDSKYIIEQLFGADFATLVGLSANGSITSVDVEDSTAFIRGSVPFTLEADDGGSGDTLRAFTETVADVEQLSRYAATGTLVRVIGRASDKDDDYWLRYEVEGEGLGNGFGQTGVWRETYNPYHVRHFDASTMPHRLVKTGPTTFELQQADWVPRRTGGDVTNPFPDFLGHPIRDIGGLQGRMVLACADAGVALSVTNRPLDFFKKTATDDLDTDPIGVKSTTSGDSRIDWLIPLDRDLILLSDPGAGQFLLSGNTKLTSSNAAVVRTTAFDIKSGTKPVETARTIMFPFKVGDYSGVNEFFPRNSDETRPVDTLTATQDRLIRGRVNHMAVSTTFNRVAFKTDFSETHSTVWIYKYLWQGDEKVQSSWYEYEFPTDVRFFFFEESEFVTVLFHGQGRYSVCVLDLNRTDDPSLGYKPLLDLQETQQVTEGQVTLPYPDAVIVQGSGCQTPGSVAPVLNVTPNSGQFDYQVDTRAVPNGAYLVCGKHVDCVLDPTMPRVRDRDGNVVPRTALVPDVFFIEYSQSGPLRASLSSAYRETYEITDNWFVGSPGVDVDVVAGTRSGVLEFPAGERSDWSQLRIRSTDHRPINITEIQYTGGVLPL